MSETFEEVLEKYGTLTYTNKGTSMLPMLRAERDVFTVVRNDKKDYKENDVVLFRQNGKYVLHRIVKVDGDCYTTMGDNCLTGETGIRNEDILGVLVSFERDGKTYSVDDKRYLLYVAWIRRTEGIRVFLKRSISRVKSLIKKVLR